MLINSIELLREARKIEKCIPAFNIYNFETVQAVFEASVAAKRPIIAAFGEGYLKNVSLTVIAAIVKTMALKHPYPVVLHLDHCKSFDIIKDAIETGFTSVMYDGSKLPLKENIKNTRNVVQYAHQRGVSVEGELGSMNVEDGSEADKTQNIYTDAGQSEVFVRETNIDSLAVVIGNAHGLYKGIPNLNMQRLREIYKATDIPLVLHGSSGIPEEQLKQAVSIAVAKINVNTEIALAASSRIYELLKSNENMRLEKLMLGAQESMTEIMTRYYSIVS